MFELDYWIEGIITKTWALVSLDLFRDRDLRSDLRSSFSFRSFIGIR